MTSIPPAADDYLKCMFSRFGGKCNKAKLFVTYFPEHETFVEPFLGSGALFLAKNKSTNSVINDLDPLMYSIWTNVKSSGKKFDEINESTPFDFKPNRKRWDTFLKTHKQGTAVEKLYKSLYVMRNSFNGSGTSFSPNRYPPTQSNYKIKLEPYQKKLKGVTILKKDYKEVIKKYDNKDAFFYLDPPYEIAIKKGGYYEYSDIDLEELRDLLSKVKGKFLMSLDITPTTKKLFKDFYQKKILFQYATKKVNKNKYEYLISNYKF